MITKAEIYNKVTEHRERFVKDATNLSLGIGISNIFIEGYLAGLVDAGVITKKEMERAIESGGRI